MNVPQDDGPGQVPYAYLASLGLGLPEQLIPPGVLMQGGTQLVPAGQYKNCNCKKAKCLKLYCVCFQAGVYCNGCSCTDCLNLQVNDELITRERNRILQREGPQAFGRKNAIQAAGVHLKGCRCSRSKCAKKYCECYDYQVPCSELCKCKDCKNPKNKDIGMPRFAVTAAQQQQLLMAMQQKQLLGTEAMDVDGPTVLQMQLMQQQQQQPSQLRLEDLTNIPGLSMHPGALPSSQPGSKPASQPSSRPASPAQQAVLKPGTLQQLAGLPPVVRRSSAAAQPSGPVMLQVQAPQQQGSQFDAAAAEATAEAQDAAEAAAGPETQDGEYSAGMQLLQQYGHWLQVPVSAGLSALAAAASDAHAVAVTPQQQAAASAAAAASNFVAEISAARTSNADKQATCSSEQPLMTNEALPAASLPATKSNSRSSREPSEGPISERAAAAGEEAIVDQTLRHGIEVATALTEPSIDAVRQPAAVKVEVNSAGASQAAAAATSAAGTAASAPAATVVGMSSIAPGRGIQSGLFAANGVEITTAARQRQQVAQKPHHAEKDEDAAIAAAAGAGNDLNASAPKTATAAGQQQLEQEHAVAAASVSVQQQLLAAVSSYMCQMPYMGAAAAMAAAAGNARMFEPRERQHHQPFSMGALPVTYGSYDLSRMQSKGAMTAAAEQASRQVVRGTFATAVADSEPAAEAAEGTDCADGGEADDGLWTTGVDGAGLLEDPESAAELARSVGLDEAAADAAKQAALFLQCILRLSTEGADSAAAAASIAEQQQLLVRQLRLGQQQLLDMYGPKQTSLLSAGAAGPQVAVLTDRPLAAVQSAAAMTRLSPAVQALQRQQSALANSPQSSLAAAPAATPAAAGLYASLHAKGLTQGVGGVTCTPSPVTAQAYRYCGSVRGPSPLGPVSHLRGRESGLQALLGSGKHSLLQQQQQQGTPVSGPPVPPGAPGSGTSSAAGASARRSMQLLPGNFRIAGNINSPAVSHDSPANPATTAANAAVLSHLAGLRGEYQHADSPAGSLSFAPSNASMGQAEQHTAATAAGAAEGTAVTFGVDGCSTDERTPVFSNEQKVSTDQQQEQQCDLHQPAQAAQEPMQAVTATAADTIAAEAAAAAGVSPVVSFPMPAPSAGAHTPLTECEVAAQMAAAAARMVSAPTPSTWQSQAAQGSLSGKQGTDPDPVAAILGSFSGQGWPGMTPAGIDIVNGNVRSVLAGLSPFDPASFLSSPLPHMTSVLREAATGGGSGLRALGLRLHDITPVLLNLQQHAGAASTGGSSGARRRAVGGKSTSGVKALCAGWGEGTAGAAGRSAAAAAGAAAAAESCSDVVVVDGAVAPGIKPQIDAPASGRKLDTDKAAARAAAGSVEGSQDAVGYADNGCDAGMNSLIAAANFICTPGYDDEMPTKRRRQDISSEQPCEQPVQHQQQHSKAVNCGTSTSWAVFQELDIKHAADGTAEKLHVSAAAAASGQADAGSKAFSFTAQARRVLLPPPAPVHNSQQQLQQQVGFSQSDQEHQVVGDWGSQLASGRSPSADVAGNQPGQHTQQLQHVTAEPQNLAYGVNGSQLPAEQSHVTGLNDMQQKQEQLAAQHMQQWGSQQLTRQSTHSSTTLELIEPGLGYQLQSGHGMALQPPAIDATVQGFDAVAAKIAAHLQPIEQSGPSHNKQEMFITSPPANPSAKPGGLTPGKGTADRSPSVDYHEYADAMLQLSRAV